MFLKELKEIPQKVLFLELTTLIMMVEGDKATTSRHIEKQKFDNNSYLFWQNIEEKEFTVLTEYAFEMELIDSSSSQSIIQNIIDQPITIADFYLSSFVNIADGRYKLEQILQQQIELVLEEFSYLENFRKEMMEKIISDGEDFFKLSPEKIQQFMLLADVVKQEILKRTAKELIFLRKEYVDKLDSKKKKIILFELIGAGFSSGNFEEQEKKLLENICHFLDIDTEYMEEFLEVASRLLNVNKELVELINE